MPGMGWFRVIRSIMEEKEVGYGGGGGKVLCAGLDCCGCAGRGILGEVEGREASEKMEAGAGSADGSAGVAPLVCGGSGSVPWEEARSSEEMYRGSVKGVASGVEVGSRACAFRQDLYAATSIGAGRLYFLVGYLQLLHLSSS